MLPKTPYKYLKLQSKIKTIKYIKIRKMALHCLNMSLNWSKMDDDNLLDIFVRAHAKRQLYCCNLK